MDIQKEEFNNTEPFSFGAWFSKAKRLPRKLKKLRKKEKGKNWRVIVTVINTAVNE